MGRYISVRDFLMARGAKDVVQLGSRMTITFPDGASLCIRASAQESESLLGVVGRLEVSIEGLGSGPGLAAPAFESRYALADAAGVVAVMHTKYGSISDGLLYDEHHDSPIAAGTLSELLDLLVSFDDVSSRGGMLSRLGTAAFWEGHRIIRQDLAIMWRELVEAERLEIARLVRADDDEK